MEVWFCFFAIIIFSAILRYLPHVIAPLGMGVDHWFWKAYIEEYRKNKRFPPVLPQYLLDQHQWYPPLFPLIMARLPDFLLDRFSHILAIVIDLIRLALLMTAAYMLTGRVNSLIGAGIVYSLTPILISYNVQLNPRGLGALFLDVIVLLLVWLIWLDGPLWIWAVVTFVSGLILLTHKMTTQLFWFLCIFAGVCFYDWRLVMLVPLSIVSALIMSKGFYFNVFKAHRDIVSFWDRNWRWLTVHPILESPVYRNPGYETPTKYFRTGVKGLARRLLYLLGFNPWIWAVLVAALYMYAGEPMETFLTIEDAWMAQWLGLILLFMLLTTFIPFMRCLGNGYLYGYNASFPAGLLIAMIWGGLKHDKVVEYILYGTFFLCLIGIAYFFWTLKNSKTQKIDEDMDHVIKNLKDMPNGVVMCFPNHWHNVLAYKAKKSVLYGAHGFGFNLIEFISPRLLKPIKEVISKYKVKYLLTYDGYLPENFLEDLPDSSLSKFGVYHLYIFKENFN
jgi:hypothetical protein